MWWFRLLLGVVTARGKTTPTSTGGSFAPASGPRSRVEPDQATAEADEAADVRRRFDDADWEAAAVMSFAGMPPVRVTGTHDGEPVIEYRIEAESVTFEVRLHDDGSHTEAVAYPTGDGWESVIAAGGRDAILGTPAGLGRLREHGVAVRDFARCFRLGDHSPGDVVESATNLAWAVGDEER